MKSFWYTQLILNFQIFIVDFLVMAIYVTKENIWRWKIATKRFLEIF